MSVGPRITPSNPVRKLGRMDYERCAALHNELYHLSWRGSCPSPHITWWEYFSPSQNISESLDPSLVEFLKLAFVKPKGKPKGPVDSPALFYWVRGLNAPDAFFETLVEDLYPGRFVWLYCTTGYNMGDERGIVYDQEESLAAFIGYIFEEPPMCIQGWGFKPLEVILDAYLEMIDEGKVTLMGPSLPMWPGVMKPWVLHPYTKVDVDKALSAMQKLLDTIQARQPAREATNSYNPWSDQCLLTSTDIPPETFVYDFLTGLAPQRIPFRYIAPGIRLPTVSEFTSQPYLGSYPTNDPTSLPLLLFYTDNKKGLGHDLHPLLPPPPPPSYPPPSNIPELPAGLYIESIHSKTTRAFSNTCYLLLPFKVGQNGWTRTSDGAQTGIDIDDIESHPKGDDKSLYQSGLNGFGDRGMVQLDKVLLRWAQMVEDGEWEIGEDGVVDKIERFKDADTEMHWYKYCLPPSW
ncbi:hypothetical protein ABOM_001633 [Aspergillus bombycis]|uniref:Uncharacterized protein n=1 Tax=Aspergillus bombycis TaxID=109264 RepID=A0A1F8ADZ3_9EURO|nr:hypothetical protein ABOM_001633 [Aspergillus bombycis]OGM49595.1 hypothetical protein ABOM_001633 [Aspergillus bombycis]